MKIEPGIGDGIGCVRVTFNYPGKVKLFTIREINKMVRIYNEKVKYKWEEYMKSSDD